MVLLGAVEAFTVSASEGMVQMERGIEIYSRLPTPPVFWGLLLQIRAPIAAMTGDLDRALSIIDEAVTLTSTQDRACSARC